MYAVRSDSQDNFSADGTACGGAVSSRWPRAAIRSSDLQPGVLCRVCRRDFTAANVDVVWARVAKPGACDASKYVDQVAGLTRSQRKLIKQGLRRLRTLREDADYRPLMAVDASAAQTCLRDVDSVFRVLALAR